MGCKMAFLLEMRGDYAKIKQMRVISIFWIIAAGLLLLGLCKFLFKGLLAGIQVEVQGKA